MIPPAPYTLPALREVEGAVLVKVRVSPGASREGLAGLHGDALKVAVAAPPERGRANRAVARLLAARMGLRGAEVKLHSGETSRDKWFRVDGIGRSDLEAILRNLFRQGKTS